MSEWGTGIGSVGWCANPSCDVIDDQSMVDCIDEKCPDTKKCGLHAHCASCRGVLSAPSEEIKEKLYE